MRTHPEGHGPVRYGPPLPEDGLPVLPELTAVLAAAAARSHAEPVGGGTRSWRPLAPTRPGAACPPNPTTWPPPPAPPPSCWP